MLEYVADVGGIASTLDYPYEGQNNFCRCERTGMVVSRDGQALSALC
jgi:hypothetical protein